jgi:hypothetical protein
MLEQNDREQEIFYRELGQVYNCELCFKQKFRSAKLLPEIVYVAKVFCAQKTLGANCE